MPHELRPRPATQFLDSEKTMAIPLVVFAPSGYRGLAICHDARAHVARQILPNLPVLFFDHTRK
jgi:hypothetical protein